MKFDKAYCIELDEVVTPYAARDRHFNESGEWYLQKLNFLCEDKRCRAKLTGVNIYSIKRIKMPLHFRTWRDCEHSLSCEIVKSEGAQQSGGRGGRNIGEGEMGYKPSHFPNVFLLERPLKSSESLTDREPDSGGESRVKAARQRGGRHASGDEKFSPVVTSFLENVVDCFNAATAEELRTHLLTIDGKTLSYRRFFKKIIYFQDGPGLIYYGPVEEVKSYGGDFRIRFRERIWDGDKKFRISIYLRKELIDAYRRSRLFRDTLAAMKESNEEIECFFVGAYPELVTIRHMKEGVEVVFEEYKVDITNLDHLVVTFSNRGPAG
jgi:hypothetical protein